MTAFSRKENRKKAVKKLKYRIEILERLGQGDSVMDEKYKLQKLERRIKEIA